MSPNGSITGKVDDSLLQLNLDLKYLQKKNVQAKHHGDVLLADKKVVPAGLLDDLKHILTLENAPVVAEVIKKFITTHGLDMKAAAPLVGSLSNNSTNRQKLVEEQVKIKYDRMLHPPLTYLGDAFQYRTVDGKFNSALHPHLGQAGAPYAKTVPANTHPLGAMPDPADVFDKLMARRYDRPSQSGLSSILIYHATIIIHDIFRTNDKDKNISDSSSYLDLSPLYGYTEQMQRDIRDSRYKLGLLKPDVFAEDRLLRQPPGVCILLVMYNRYHNYAATQLRRINENGRFSIPAKFGPLELVAVAKHFTQRHDEEFREACKEYTKVWKAHEAAKPPSHKDTTNAWKEIRSLKQRVLIPKNSKYAKQRLTQEECDTEVTRITAEMQKKIDDFNENSKEAKALQHWTEVMEKFIPDEFGVMSPKRSEFIEAYKAAWTKNDDDLFNTARLITCGLYIQISIHDYLRALMGFHQFNTDFTLEPRGEIDHKNVSRGIGNQVSVEFNLLYRFHCAISKRDQEYTERYMRDKLKIDEPCELSLEDFLKVMKEGSTVDNTVGKIEPWYQEFGIEGTDEEHFQRNAVTGLFDDQQMVDALVKSMDDPISNFGPRNTPTCLKPVEIMGIIQARKWGVGTLNDFRDFFGMSRHETFESISANVDIQDALRDLYEHPDKVELYPGVFCESDANMGVDPGPSDVSSALWAAIFSDAITLVRSDRFYTVDWNTQSLTSWGMKEVTADSNILKSSLFHRLIQRAFPGWFPYDSIRFFHPFYTGQTNAKFAKAQGYADDFRIPPGVDELTGKPFDMRPSNPHKPEKPLVLTEYRKISQVLEDESYAFMHPAFLDVNNFPKAIRGMVKYITTAGAIPQDIKTSLHPHVIADGFLGLEETSVLGEYFKDLMTNVIKRESVPMGKSTYQIDATRDFAVPVVARYISDFLGFGRLVDTKKNLKAQFTENEIYRHITNCQTYMSYNADETKLLKRRKDFRTSFEFLYEQTLDGNVAEAKKWEIFQRRRDNAMTDFGFKVAQRVLQHQGSAQNAAAVIVFIALNSAHNAVLSFTTVMNFFMADLYGDLKRRDPPIERGYWKQVQELAFKEDDKSLEELTALVLEADGLSVHLPIVRIAMRECTFDKNHKPWTIQKGETVILDLSRANPKHQKNKSPAETDFLPFHASVTDVIAGYHPKHLAVMGLTLMVRFFARMKDLRRGSFAQGRVKMVHIDASPEGYSNYMAPMRLDRIATEANSLENEAERHKLYTKQLLQPASDTFMNTEWDEMLPFPSTWKLLYDGFGRSTYKVHNKHGKQIDMLRWGHIFDDAPPFYQPRGPSHTGGTFAGTVDSNTSLVLGDQTAHAMEATNLEHFYMRKTATSGPLPEFETYSTGCGMGP